MPEIQVNLNHNIPAMLAPLGLADTEFHIEGGDILVVKDSTGVTQQQLEDVVANYDNTPYERKRAREQIDKDTAADIEALVTPREQVWKLAQCLERLCEMLIAKRVITRDEFANRVLGPEASLWQTVKEKKAQSEREKSAFL